MHISRLIIAAYVVLLGVASASPVRANTIVTIWVDNKSAKTWTIGHGGDWADAAKPDSPLCRMKRAKKTEEHKGEHKEDAGNDEIFTKYLSFHQSVPINSGDEAALFFKAPSGVQEWHHYFKLSNGGHSLTFKVTVDAKYLQIKEFKCVENAGLKEEELQKVVTMDLKNRGVIIHADNVK